MIEGVPKGVLVKGTPSWAALIQIFPLVQKQVNLSKEPGKGTLEILAFCVYIQQRGVNFLLVKVKAGKT